MHHRSLSLFFALLCLARTTLAQDSIDSLIEAVNGADKNAALQAIDSLTDLGPGAKPAVDALQSALGNEDSEIAWHAARALGAIGPEAIAAADALVASLDSPDTKIRAYSAYALGGIGDDRDATVKSLVDLVFDEDALVRRASIRAVRAIDPPSEVVRPMMLKMLEQSDPAIVMPALASLAEGGKEVVPKLRDALKDEKACHWACLVLAEIGEDGVEAVPELIGVFDHKSPDTRLNAVIAAGEVGPDAKDAVPAIVELLKNDPFAEVRHAAAYSLGKIRVKNDEVNEALVAAAKGDDEFLGLVASWALARVNPDRADVIKYSADRLVEGLASDDQFMRSAAARGLAEFDEHSDIVAPALVAALKDANPTVVGNAMDALAAMGPKVVDRVCNGLKNEDLRIYAVHVLYRMGRDAAAAVPALTEALKEPIEGDDDVLFHREVQIALAAIGPAAKAAVPELIQSLSNENVAIRGSACYALGEIGAGAAAAVPELKKQLAGDMKPKLGFVWALLKIEPGNQQHEQIAVPVLIEGLSDEFEVVREEAAEALGNLGAKAASALEPLKTLLEDPVPAVRDAAQEAIERIGTP